MNPSLYDIAIIGGGINGCGIARDAAGRGWRVFLCEQADLGGATSSASTKLIHGGLRYLEHHEFRLVREALQEREVLWRIAPHIIWPLRFILPHHQGLRPAWLLRLGLFLYDHLGGRKRLPPTRTLRLAGEPLKPAFTRGFEYSDCWVEDSRLVVLNARDAADRGATIAPRTTCLSARRDGALWRLALRDERTGRTFAIHSRSLVNAAGPWVARVAAGVLGDNAPATVRLVQGSHIVVPRLYDHDHCYIFQNTDGRIFFLIPYEQDFTLIGTTDQDFHGDPAQVHATDRDVRYLCQAASAYLRRPVTPEMVVWRFSGVRPLYDEGSKAAQQVSRDYVLKLDAPAEGPPLLSVFGGKITTYRRLAESALMRLGPLLPAGDGLPPGWTGTHPLPGGDFPIDGFEPLLAAHAARRPFMPKPLLRRLLRAYGTRLDMLLDGVSCLDDLGRDFGGGLYEVEVRYLMAQEWAITAQDVLWRRTRRGLRLAPSQVAALDDAMQGMIRTEAPEAAS